MDRNEAMVKERFANDVKDHVVTVKHLDGLYRHYRCQKPGTWNMGFDVVTWPGSLCYTGDMGEFLFQRTDDMIKFMAPGIKECSYLASKCVAGKDEIKEWSGERFREVLAERLKDSAGDDGEFTVVRRGGRVKEKVIDKIREIEMEYSNYESRFDAEKAMYESGLWDGCDMPSCEEYTLRFLWCLYAIEWFCAKLQASGRSGDRHPDT